MDCGRCTPQAGADSERRFVDPRFREPLPQLADEHRRQLLGERAGRDPQDSLGFDRPPESRLCVRALGETH